MVDINQTEVFLVVDGWRLKLKILKNNFFFIISEFKNTFFNLINVDRRLSTLTRLRFSWSTSTRLRFSNGRRCWRCRRPVLLRFSSRPFSVGFNESVMWSQLAVTFPVYIDLYGLMNEWPFEIAKSNFNLPSISDISIWLQYLHKFVGLIWYMVHSQVDNMYLWN